MTVLRHAMDVQVDITAAFDAHSKHCMDSQDTACCASSDLWTIHFLKEAHIIDTAYPGMPFVVQK